MGRSSVLTSCPVPQIPRGHKKRAHPTKLVGIPTGARSRVAVTVSKIFARPTARVW